MNRFLRRRPQFSLVTLLVAMLTIGSLTGLGLREVKRRQRDAEERAMIQKARRDAWDLNFRAR